MKMTVRASGPSLVTFKLATLSFLVSMLFISACARNPSKSQIDPNAYAQELSQWQQKRWADLKGDSGWLTLVGLFWLKEGENKFGSDRANDIVISKLAAHAGSFSLAKGAVKIDATQPGFTVDGKPIKSLELKTDDDDKPTIVHFDSVSFQIIKRGNKLGVRVKDSQNPDRLNFKDTEFYPADLKWRIEAQFEPYNPPKQMPIVNVLNMESSESSPGAIKFTAAGQEYRLDAITEKDEPRFFMIIADKTSGKETYPAGRYLYVDPPDASGRVIIDFNKAYSPPCAFTKFATCPLPPKQNRLPFAIEAGEKYQKHIE
ncbi:MAG: hypothetical protein DMF72_07930 [Acidobacteria bacterium]|nr:MAG: hypothetical protein DMF72_07930 [Acidobacteriota bacterium]